MEVLKDARKILQKDWKDWGNYWTAKEYANKFLRCHYKGNTRDDNIIKAYLRKALIVIVKEISAQDCLR
jgi:hypothetical protein